MAQKTHPCASTNSSSSATASSPTARCTCPPGRARKARTSTSSSAPTRRANRPCARPLATGFSASPRARPWALCTPCRSCAWAAPCSAPPTHPPWRSSAPRPTRTPCARLKMPCCPTPRWRPGWPTCSARPMNACTGSITTGWWPAAPTSSPPPTTSGACCSSPPPASSIWAMRYKIWSLKPMSCGRHASLARACTTRRVTISRLPAKT